MKEKKKIILGVTGSIAAYKAADLASRFVQKGHQVFVVMTPEAERFIAPLTLQAITRNKVGRDMFEAPEAWDIEHVALADSADLVVIAPATANVIGKLAAGLCDDLLTCAVTATKAPVLIAPAMNEGMYTHKAVQRNVETLKKMGYRFVGPDKGRLACGKTGVGRMSDVEAIVRAAGELL